MLVYLFMCFVDVEDDVEEGYEHLMQEIGLYAWKETCGVRIQGQGIDDLVLFVLLKIQSVGKVHVLTKKRSSVKAEDTRDKVQANHMFAVPTTDMEQAATQPPARIFARKPLSHQPISKERQGNTSRHKVDKKGLIAA